MIHFAEGSATADISLDHARELIRSALAEMGPLRRVLIVPPDTTRLHSWAGELTCIFHELLSPTADVWILPALGTHSAMTEAQITNMFPGIPVERFCVHRWRDDTVEVGTVPAEFVEEVSSGRVAFEIRCAVNRMLVEQHWDAVISVGQLVPHEVAGIANHSKNIVVGLGGKDVIDKSHFLGAVCGLETIMGRIETPVRAVFDYMMDRFLPELPVVYTLTVRNPRPDGSLATRGLFCGTGREPYTLGAPLAAETNIVYLPEPIDRAVVWLDPAEYKSTWLGNKAIYRLRMAMADDGELIILGPGVREFGEDPAIDAIIRRFGYHGTEAVLRHVETSPELAANLSAAAHLIHGSSEGRFRITWCAGGLEAREVERAGFGYAPIEQMIARYSPTEMQPDWNNIDGERVYYVPNPSLGLWSLSSRETSGGSA